MSMTLEDNSITNVRPVNVSGKPAGNKESNVEICMDFTQHDENGVPTSGSEILITKKELETMLALIKKAEVEGC